MEPADLWNATVAASPALGALLAWRLALRDRMHAARPSGPVLTHVDGVSDGAAITLSGTLLAPREPTREGSVVALRAEVKRRAEEGAAEGLRIRLGDGRADLAIEGRVRVAQGAREAPPWGDLGDVEGAALAWAARLHGLPQERARGAMTRVRALCHGDPVLVRARLEARPEGGDGAYREARVRHVLVADGDAVTLYGAGAPPRIPARRVALGAFSGVVAALSFWTLVGMVAGGLAHGGRSRSFFDGTRRCRVFDGSALAARVAMVSPLERRRAHHTLAESLRDQPRPTREALDEASREFVAAGDCVSAAQLAMSRGDPQSARRIGERGPCRDAPPPRWSRALAAYAAGDFADASELFAPDVPHVDLYASYVDDHAFDLRLHVLAGDLADTTAVARRRAAATSRNRRSTSAEIERAALFECLAAYGDHAPLTFARFEALRTRAEGEVAREPCELLMLDRMTPSERRGWLDRHGGASRSRVGALLAWEAGRVPSVAAPCGGDWSAILSDPVGEMSRRAPGIEHALVRMPGFDDTDETWRAQVDLRCSLAAFEALAGDLRAARAYAEGADARAAEAARLRPSPWVTGASRGAALLRSVIALLDGDDEGARRALPAAPEDEQLTEEAFPARTRAGVRAVMGFLEARATTAGSGAFRGVAPPLARDAVAGWDVASTRDGRSLAEHLYTHQWSGLPTWVTWGDRGVTRGRADVARWIETVAPAPCVRCTVRRRLAELALARRTARRWGSTGPDELTLASFTRALRARRLAVPLRVLDDLRENAAELSW